ncbi:hypothetical protein ABZ281_09510 [Streptomyces sp. NPDC006265]|uniref:hypothetical protein n=1 Tax=Streptomyces sp. NPDC006265 TaxID=3156740 RepID=UPI0033B54555
MTTPEPDRQGTPDGSDATPSDTGDVWLKFLADNERAIRESAPKEPSAQERASARTPRRRLDAGRQHPPGRRPDHAPTDDRADAVGDLWQPESPEPAWRELNGPARLRRAGRVIATAAAIGLALGAWSWLSTTAGDPAHQPGVGTVQELEEAPDAIPTTSPVPTAVASASTVPIG